MDAAHWSLCGAAQMRLLLFSKSKLRNLHASIDFRGFTHPCDVGRFDVASAAGRDRVHPLSRHPGGHICCPVPPVWCQMFQVIGSLRLRAESLCCKRMFRGCATCHWREVPTCPSARRQTGPDRKRPHSPALWVLGICGDWVRLMVDCWPRCRVCRLVPTGHSPPTKANDPYSCLSQLRVQRHRHFGGNLTSCT